MESDDNKKFASSESADNVILVVEGKEIVVSKVYLSLQSPYFKDLFSQGMVKFDLKNAKYKQFIELLNVVYPWQKTIVEKNVDEVLEYAARYQMTFVFQRCETLVVSHPCWCKAQKLLVCDKHHLDKARDQLISQVCFQDLKDFNYNKHYNELSSDMKAALLDRVVKGGVLNNCSDGTPHIRSICNMCADITDDVSASITTRCYVCRCDTKQSISIVR